MDLILGLILGLAVGVLLGVLWASRRERAAQQALRTERDNLAKELEDQKQRNQELQLLRVDLEARLRAAEEKVQWLGQAKEALEATFKALAGDALRDNAAQL
ncbi:MAG: hypothetical protein QXE28_05065, partial [Desulfurococcaceae archaeon]